MADKPLDVLRLAHRDALHRLDLLEHAVRGLGEMGGSSLELERVSSFFDNELRMHFRHEEEVLFPYLARVIGRDGPISAMLDEHKSLWRAWDAFQEKVEALKGAVGIPGEKDVQAAQQVATHIVAFLRAHIQKEDTVLFPLAEETLGPEDLKEAVARIQAVETLV